MSTKTIRHIRDREKGGGGGLLATWLHIYMPLPLTWLHVCIPAPPPPPPPPHQHLQFQGSDQVCLRGKFRRLCGGWWRVCDGHMQSSQPLLLQPVSCVSGLCQRSDWQREASHPWCETAHCRWGSLQILWTVCFSNVFSNVFLSVSQLLLFWGGGSLFLSPFFLLLLLLKNK